MIERRPGPRSRALVALLAACIVIMGLFLPSSDVLDRAEALSLDTRLRLAGARPPHAEVVLVSVDEVDLEAAGGWPIDRRYLAELVAALDRAGAKTIVLDTLLVDRHVGIGSGDAPLAAAMAAHGAVLLPIGIQERANGADLPRGLARFAVVRGPWAVAAMLHGGALPPSPQLASAAAALAPSIVERVGVGNASVVPAAFAIGEDLVPTLPVEAVRIHQDVSRGALWYDSELGALLGGVPLAPAAAGRYRLRAYGPPGTIPTLNARNVLSGDADLMGFLAVVGIDAPAAGERFATPFASSVSGAEMLAIAVANLLEGRSLLSEAPQAPLGLLLVVIASLAAAWGLGRSRPATSLLMLILLATTLVVATQMAVSWWDLALPVVAPLAALLLSGMLIEALRLFMVQRAERALAFERENLSRFFPPAVADRLAGVAAPGTLDATIDATVVFIDVVRSSALVEQLEPALAMAVFRRVFVEVERIVFEEGGTLVTFLGDGALVAFGVPEPRADATTAALRAARRLLALFRDDDLDLAIGVHHGRVLVGNVGGVRQFQFTIMGDTVHLASRLQGIAAELDAALVISAAALEEVADAPLREGLAFRPDTAIRGRQGLVDIWYLARERPETNAPAFR